MVLVWNVKILGSSVVYVGQFEIQIFAKALVVISTFSQSKQAAGIFTAEAVNGADKHTIARRMMEISFFIVGVSSQVSCGCFS
jgi:hypothetical protein